MARREHGRMAFPEIFGRIEAFDLPVNTVRALATHAEDAVVEPHGAMAGARCGDRREEFPGVGLRIVSVMQVRIGVETVHPPGDDVDLAVESHDAAMVAAQRHGLAAGIAVGLHVIDEVPVDRAAIIGANGSADDVDIATERDAGHGAAGFGQAANLRPFRAVEMKHLVMRGAVLLDEAAECEDALIGAGAVGREADMVCAARQGGEFLPFVRAGVIGMVIRLVDALFGIAAAEVHPALIGHGPGHFRARNGQRGARAPASLLRGPGCGALGHGVLEMERGRVDPPRLVQALELPGMMRMRVLREGRRCRNGGQGGEEGAACEHGVVP